MRQQILEAEVQALRAEIARRDATPMPALRFYASDYDSLADMIRQRGVHPTENETVAQAIKDLIAWGEGLHAELREVLRVAS